MPLAAHGVRGVLTGGRRERQTLRLTVGVPLVALLACAPVLTTRYAYVDDYSILWAEEHGQDVASLGFGQGRPVAVLLHWLLLSLVDGISGLVLLRLVSVLTFAALAVLLGRAMLARGYSAYAAWVVAVGLFWLPSTAIMVSWSILFFGPVAALLAAGAGVLAVPAVENDRRRSTVSVLTRPRTLLALALLSAAMLCYQPAAMVFWPTVFLMLAAPARRPGWRPLVLPVTTATAMGVAALAVGFAAVKLGAVLSSQASTRAGLVTQYRDKAEFLLGNVIPYALYPWNLGPRLLPGLLVGAALVIGLLLTLPGARTDRVVVTALGCASVALGWLASLPIEESTNYARTGVGVMVAQVVLVGVVVDGVLRRTAASSHRTPLLAPAVVVAATVFAVVWMNGVLTTYVTGPAAVELTRAEDVLRGLSGEREVWVLTALPGATVAPGTASEEFGRSTGSVYWALQGITELAYREVHGRWPAAGMFRYPTDEEYTAGHLRELPADGGLVLDYQLLVDPTGESPIYPAGPTQ
jgi:hypothetical protein